MLRPYPKYKDSGAEWIGKIPEHWEIKRLKYNLGLLTEKTDRRTNPVALENIESWSGRFIQTETVFEGDGVAFERGDILFGKLRPYLAKAYLAETAGEAVGDFHVMRPTKGVDSGLAQYQILNREFIAIVDGSTFGAKMPRASWDFLGNMILATPPTSEQKIIAAFLICETAKIDLAIEKQERLIALLQEQRQAMITQAVTKGLDPSVPMKDSGINWLKKIPKHWEVRRFKDIIDFQEGPGIMAVDFHDEGVPLLRIGNLSGDSVALEGCNYLDAKKVEQKWSHYRLQQGDLLITSSASMGNVSEVLEDAVGSIAYTGIIRLRPSTSNLTMDFIRLIVSSALFSNQIDLLKSGATIQHFGPTHLKEIIVILPPVREQTEIVKSTSRQHAKFNKMIDLSNRQMNLLKERRSALISAAVTGKIDVRGWKSDQSRNKKSEAA